VAKQDVLLGMELGIAGTDGDGEDAPGPGRMVKKGNRVGVCLSSLLTISHL
jgi:hypothetical protein